MRIALHQEVMMVSDAFRLNSESCVSQLSVMQDMGNKYIIFLIAIAFEIAYSALIKQQNNVKHHVCQL